MKYIVTNNEKGIEEIFVFPSRYHHSDMADVVCHLKTFNTPFDWERHYKEPIAAGFTDGIICQGYSETLNLKSRGKVDAALLKV
jgi:hypothetical protein